ncbi:MAG: hypothetical protein J5857_05025 [Treponema sp.]|nr:hypothetical protein [Treponema sp.]
MKRFSKVMVVLAALLLGCAFIGCSNSPESGGGTTVAGARAYNIKEVKVYVYPDPNSFNHTSTTYTKVSPEWNDWMEYRADLGLGPTVYYKKLYKEGEGDVPTYSFTGEEGSFREEEEFEEYLEGITSNDDVTVAKYGDDIEIDVGNSFSDHIEFFYDCFGN